MVESTLLKTLPLYLHEKTLGVMIMRSLKWTCLSLLFYVGNLSAITVDPNVVSVVSSPGDVGSAGAVECRVILKQIGFQILSTEVQLDWLMSSDEGEGTVTITHSETIIPSGGFHVVNSARFYLKGGKQYVELLGAHNGSGERERYVFLIEPEGVFKIIKQPYQ
jgi:hypothetical protein